MPFQVPGDGGVHECRLAVDVGLVERLDGKAQGLARRYLGRVFRSDGAGDIGRPLLCPNGRAVDIRPVAVDDGGIVAGSVGDLVVLPVDAQVARTRELHVISQGAVSHRRATRRVRKLLFCEGGVELRRQLLLLLGNLLGVAFDREGEGNITRAALQGVVRSSRGSSR